MEKNFLVGTGIRVFKIAAQDSRDAIAQLKAKIEEAGRNRLTFADLVLDDDGTLPEALLDPNRIGDSLIDALAAGTLNFVVFDEERTTILAGELNGVHQESPDLGFRIALQKALEFIVPDACVDPHRRPVNEEVFE